MSMYKRKPDIIIKNGTIVDGTGAPAYYADIAIVGDKIVCIGDLKGVDAALVIDADHKYVTPGFIDPHCHADFTMWANPENGNNVYQGVATCVVGNCGYSMNNFLANVPFDPAGDGVECVYDYAAKGISIYLRALWQPYWIWQTPWAFAATPHGSAATTI